MSKISHFILQLPRYTQMCLMKFQCVIIFAQKLIDNSQVTNRPTSTNRGEQKERRRINYEKKI